MWIRLAALSIATLLALTAPSASAQIEDLQVNLSEFSAPDTSSVDVTLTVIDSESRPVLDLGPGDFNVTLNGQPVPASSLERGVDSEQPISVILALDVSGSMTEGGAMEEAKAAAIAFLANLEPQDSVAVLTFATDVDLVLPFTTDRDAAVAAIEGLVAGGATALYDATEASLRLVAAEGGFGAVVLLSDGVDNGSALSREQALASAGALGVPVFGIGLGHEIDPEYLQALAEASGGTFAETPSPDGLAQLYQQAGELLRGHYILSLDTSETTFVLSEPATLRVDVALGDQIGRVERAVCAQALCVALSAVDERLESITTVTADVISSEPIVSVAFEIDGVVVATVTEQPYQFTLDPAAFEDGERTLSVTVATESGESVSSQALINIGAAGEGGVSMLLVASGGIVALVAGAALYLLFRRRKSRGALRKLDPDNLRPPSKDAVPVDSGPKGHLRSDDTPPRPVPVEPMGRIYVTGGNLNEQAFPIGGAPLTVGSSDRCQIRLTHEVDNEEQVPSEFMRVWVRRGQLMVHEIRRMTFMGAEGGRWAKLASGDTMPLGPFALRFELGEEAARAAAEPNGLQDQTTADRAPESPSSPQAAPERDDSEPASSLDQSPPDNDRPRFREPASSSSQTAQDGADKEEQDPSVPNVLRDPVADPDRDAPLSPQAGVEGEPPPPGPTFQPQPKE